jgi:peptidyl-prolyl cis-trans isomerase SurA
MFGVTGSRRLAIAMTAVAVSFVVDPIVATAQTTSGVAAVVNRSAITTTDVAHRVAFLRLQRQKPDAKVAREQLIDEALKRQEIARVKMSVSTQDVDASFARFAASNKMTPEQMSQILDKAGVTAEHFKSFIAVQMSWPRLINARFGSGNNRMSNQELVTRMMESKEKPVTTEYFLKQIIFVVPAAKRNAILNKRKTEAEASRARFTGCDQAKEFAATMLDVSVRDLGTTATKVTDRGVEFLAVCDKRQVSDDMAAEAVFRAEDLTKAEKSGADPNSKKYLDELRAKAQIDLR